MKNGIIWGTGIVLLLGALFLGFKGTVFNSVSRSRSEGRSGQSVRAQPVARDTGLADSPARAEPQIAGAGRESLKRSVPLRRRPESTSTQKEQRENDPANVDRLIFTALHSPDSLEREEAINALGFLQRTPEIVAACIQGLEDSDEDVRLEAALALSTLEDPEAVPALRRALEREQSLEVREAIEEALDEIGGGDLER